MGASVVLSTLWAASTLKLPVNVVALIPLTENMPSGKATKPGDVVKAMNGMTIEIDNTDAEGRLILADAMYYGVQQYQPSRMIELSTLTGAMDVALGEAFAGVFCTHDALWKELHTAGQTTGDRFWRMPFDASYLKLMKSQVADIKNTGRVCCTL
jgi:aminopeptidase